MKTSKRIKIRIKLPNWEYKERIVMRTNVRIIIDKILKRYDMKYHSANIEYILLD